MSYIALYRKWRPLTFTDVVEQTHVVTALRNTVISRRIAHAYLFCGTRGTGKTTMAKIFARAINCLSPENGDPCNKCEICRGILNESLLDVIEIDAASNNKVENVRDIRDEVAYAPASAEYKVYIIDEVHMMTTSAFNALLKTLEEPPEKVIFILATTDPHKLPATILSRCQRFDFKRISRENIASRLTYIAENSDCVLKPDAAALLARLADGALRDGVSLLDQCISTGGKEVSIEVVRAVTGMAGNEHLSVAVGAIESGRPVELIELINTLLIEGKDLQRFANDLNSYFRDLLVCTVSEQPAKLIDPSYDLKTLQIQAASLGIARISDIIRELSLLEYQLKQTTQIRTVLEAALIRMSSILPRVDATIAERISLLEQRLERAEARGVLAVPAAPGGSQGGVRGDAPANSPAASMPSAPAASAAAPADAPSGTSAPEAPSAAQTGGAPFVPPQADAVLTKVIATLNKNGKRMVSSYLSDATLHFLEDDVIGLVSPIGASVFARVENSTPLIEALNSVLGKEMRLRVFSSAEEFADASTTYGAGVPDAGASGATSSTSAPSESAELDEEKLRKAVEDMGATFEIG
ncbi:MAG: DNA polymerase III subunit gamma/tau [Bacillota bacterium]